MRKKEDILRNLDYVLELRKKSLDRNVTFKKICNDLKISQYDYQQLIYGKSSKYHKIIDKYLNNIKPINGTMYNQFLKELLERRITIKEFCTKHNIKYKNLYLYLTKKRKKKNDLYEDILKNIGIRSEYEKK